MVAIEEAFVVDSCRGRLAIRALLGELLVLVVSRSKSRALNLTRVSAHERTALARVQVKDVIQVSANGDLVFHVVLVEHGAVAAHHGIATFTSE